MRFRSLALTFCAALAVALGAAACNSLPTVQQQFQTGCTIVNGDLAIIAQSPLLNASQQQALTGVPGDATKPGIIAVNQAICKAGGQLNVTNLKLFHDSLLPAAILIAQGMPPFPQQGAIVLGLQTFGPMVQAIIDQIGAQVINAVPAAPASAPVAASGALSASAFTLK
jgi:hypothetical protein